MDWLVHQHNLDSKIGSNYKHRGKNFADFKSNVYLTYQKQQMAISEISQQAIFKKVELLQDYYKRVDEFNRGGWITFQSKFRPTVLEEFCGYLFKDLPEVKALGLDFFKKGVYAGIRIDREGNAQLETRDIDFCIGKIVRATFADSVYDVKIPILAIECKTYLDKTMFSGTQFTAQKLKGGAPRVRVLIITERNEVSLDEIPSETPVDQIYVLRDGTNDPIDSATVWDCFCEVKATIERATLEQVIKLPGKLLI